MCELEIIRILYLAVISKYCSEHKNCENCKYYSNGCNVRVFFLGEIPENANIRDLIYCSKKDAVPDDLWKDLEKGYFDERNKQND